MKKKKKYDAKELNTLRLRALQARAGYLALGTDKYMPFVEAHATKEGMNLTANDKVVIRQVMNGAAYPANAHWLCLVERALEVQKRS